MLNSKTFSRFPLLAAIGLAALFAFALPQISYGLTITGCSNLNAPNTVYYLTQSITNSGTANCIRITAHNVTLDCMGNTIDGNSATDYGVYINSVNNVTVKNCRVTDWNTRAIYIFNTQSSHFSNIAVQRGNLDGIYLLDSYRNTLVNISANDMTNIGITFQDSPQNQLINSTFKNNLWEDFDIYVPGGASMCPNYVENVNLTKYPLLYSNTTVNLNGGNYGALYLCNADNSVISNVNVEAIEQSSISNYYVENMQYTNITASGLQEAIFFKWATNNVVKNMVIKDSWNGISLSTTVTNTIFDNITIYNIRGGIERGATSYAVRIYDQSSNNVLKNSKVYDSSIGIWMNNTGGSGKNNNIFNNFFNNTQNIAWGTAILSNNWNTTRQTGTRIFGDGTLIGGNYWASPNGAGYSETCTDSNTDGICDTQYSLEAGNKNIDSIPLSNDGSITPTSPTIATHPSGWTVTVGQTATFNVVASGTSPLTYQWQKNNVNISGATSSSYTTPPTVLSDSGSTFRVIVKNLAGSITSNPATLMVTSTPPAITTQPSGQTVTEGQTATFNVVATGTAPLTYQWQKNNVNISGATGSSYTTPPTVLADSTSTFRVIVLNSAGSITSNQATLTVNAASTPPAITTQPASTIVTEGETATFSVVATGTAPLTYQWQKNNVNITGATSSSYTTPATVLADSTSTFRVIVKNIAGSNTSNYATLTVILPTAPSITTQPASQNVIQGQSATFSVEVIGTVPFTYRWQKNNIDISGATSSSYTIPVTVLPDSGSTYRVIVTNSIGSATSNSATLIVTPSSAPTIITQPSSQTVDEGDIATFSVLATGTIPLTYQWQKNGVPIAGATSQSYTTPATLLSDSGSTYSVIITNGAGSATSNSVTLTVNPLSASPSITTQPASQTVIQGQTATYDVVATGTAPLAYQWQKNGVPIAGATSQSYTTPATLLSDSGSTYSVIITNGIGSATSNSATLTVNSAPTSLSNVVAMFEKDSTVVQLGDTEQVVLTVKNIRDTRTTYDIYIGSTDEAFRNFIWFENHRNDQYRVHQKVELESHEEKRIVVNVLGGKVNDHYNLLVGPDGSDVNNIYDSISIKVADTGNDGFFSNTPDIGFLWVALVPVAASIILLTRKSR